MKTMLMSLLIGVCGLQISAQNLFNSTQQGDPISGGRIDAMTMVQEGNEVALVLAQNSTGKIYAIKLSDTDNSEQQANLVNVIPNFEDKVKSALGSNFVLLKGIAVNPISRSVYVHATNGPNDFIIKAVNGGNDLSVVDLSNVEYASMTFSSNGLNVQDITYGDKTLYVSSGEVFGGLAGEIAATSIPFSDNTSMSGRMTAMFKTNWGGGFQTNAPLEKWDYAEINGEKRLMGVTVCAPGFSFETSEVQGSGTLQVDEQFQVVYSTPQAVIHVNQDGKHYLYNLHQSFSSSNGSHSLIRIGEKYIDGSPENRNEVNSQVVRLRNTSGAVSTGLADEDITIDANNYFHIAYYDDHNFLVINENNDLTMLQVGSRGPEFDPVSSISTVNSADGIQISIFPNPSSQIMNVNVQGDAEELSLELINMSGQHMITQEVANGGNGVDVSTLPVGTYQVLIKTVSGVIHQQSVLINR